MGMLNGKDSERYADVWHFAFAKQFGTVYLTYIECQLTIKKQE